MTILHIDSSILGEGSVSRALTAQVVAQEQGRTGAAVIRRDLAAEPLRHLSGDLFAARAIDGEARTAEQRADIEASDRTLEEFLVADLIVIGAPMYNFSIPSQLKAWIDRVAIAGKTFRYTEAGPEGLAGGKRVVIVSSRGGVYSGDLSALDHQESYLRTVLGFVGITEIEIIRAEGVNFGAEQRASAVKAAETTIASRLPLAA